MSRIGNFKIMNVGTEFNVNLIPFFYALRKFNFSTKIIVLRKEGGKAVDSSYGIEDPTGT